MRPRLIHACPGTPVLLRPVEVAGTSFDADRALVQLRLYSAHGPNTRSTARREASLSYLPDFCNSGPTWYTLPTFPVAANSRPFGPAAKAVTWVGEALINKCADEVGIDPIYIAFVAGPDNRAALTNQSQSRRQYPARWVPDPLREIVGADPVQTSDPPEKRRRRGGAGGRWRDQAVVSSGPAALHRPDWLARAGSVGVGMDKVEVTG